MTAEHAQLAALLLQAAVLERAYQLELERGERVKAELRAALGDLPTRRPGDPR